MSMPSHRARPAGNRHSRDDTSLALLARHAGYLPGGGHGGGKEFLGGRVDGCLARSRKSAGTSSADGARNVCVFPPRAQGYRVP